MPKHNELTTSDLHVPGYYGDTDPGAVGAGKYWWDTSCGADLPILRLRNADDDGWDVMGSHMPLIATETSDTAPYDDTTRKKVSLQKLAAAPSNAAYIPFQNNPGTDTFYLVLEEDCS